MESTKSGKLSEVRLGHVCPSSKLTTAPWPQGYFRILDYQPR